MSEYPMQPGPTRWGPADEQRHADCAVEAWWWWGSGELAGDLGGELAGKLAGDLGSTASGDAEPVGVYVGLELRGSRFDYWAGLIREGERYLYIEELDGTGLRDGLEIKPPEMWAGHSCDVPFVQWSLGNEAHGVLLDDPHDAWHRPYGTLAPVTFDIEWYATAVPEPIGIDLPAGADGYRQRGEVDVEIELTDGVLAFAGVGERVHLWGTPYLPTSFAMPNDLRGLSAPYRRHDGVVVEQILTTTPGRASRWWVSR